MAPSGRELREAVREPAGFPETSEREFWGFQANGREMLDNRYSWSRPDETGNAL